MKKLDPESSRTPRRTLWVSGALFLLAIPIAASWDEGVASFRAKDYAAAAEAFARLVERSPTAHQAHYMLGQSLLEQRQTAAALRSFEEAVAHGDSGTYRLALARTQIKLKRPDDALATLGAMDSERLDEPSRKSFATVLSNAATGSSTPQVAEKAVRRALASHSGSKSLYLALAALTEKRGAKADQAEAYAKAFLASPRDIELGRTAARALMNVGLDAKGAARAKVYGRALEVAAQLAETAPSGDSFFLTGQAAMGLGDLKGARRWFEKSLAAEPEKLEAHLELAKVLLSFEEPAPALGHLDQALAAGPEPELLRAIHSQRGQTLRHQGQFVMAAAAYELAGRNEKVREMNELEAMRQQNEEYEQAKAECAEKERRVAELRRESQDLEGTDAWRDLEQQMQEILAGCQQFHDEA